MAHPNYYKLQKFFEESLVNLGCKEAWTGMALGGDTVFAKAVLSLQEQGYRIRLYAAIPCDNQSCKWPKASQEEYDRILSKRTDYTVVSPGPYAAWKMQKRNEYIVDHIDQLIAVYSGVPGGTRNCIEYAKHTGTIVTVISPTDIIMS